MTDFQKPNRFSKGPRTGGFSRGGSSRPSFGDRGGRPSFGAQKEMHKATCSQCHKPCEVPFRPNGKKPVYCRDCFVPEEGRQSEGGYSPRSDSRERSFAKPQASFQREDKGHDDLKKQMEALNRKLDSLIDLMQASHSPVPTLKDELSKITTVKKPAKRAVASKRK